MGTLMKKEVYTTSQPDGTYVTTTTKTTTTTDGEIGIGKHPMNINYCCSPGAILRILQIICGLFIVTLISSVFGPGPFIGVLFGQTFLVILASICICLTCIILVVLCLTLHNSHLSFWPWRSFCLVFSVVAGCCFFIGGLFEAYYATGTYDKRCNGGDDLIHNGCRPIIEWAFAAVFCFILAALYFISAWFAHMNKYFD